MATHGWWCAARTFPMHCRSCRADVFYFSCNCGSKVFFDDLGGDWPLHDCTDHIVKQVRVAIEAKYADRVAHRRKPKSWVSPIVALEPSGTEVVEDLGIVREVAEVDVYKKFRVPREGGLSAAFLGPALATNEFVQITVHTGGLSADRIHSYTFLLNRKDWKRNAAQQGDLVLFELEGVRTPRGDRYWAGRKIKLPS
jgi:hypothetical protein